MRQILILLFLCAATLMYAQSINQKQVHIEATSLSDKYNMSVNQKELLKSIVEQKYKDLNNIEGYREQDPKTYRQKRKTIYVEMEKSLQSIMTKEQLEVYKLQQDNAKMKRGKNSSKLSTKSVTKQHNKSTTKGLPLDEGY